jgi:dihydroxy-acid dehydratase
VFDGPEDFERRIDDPSLGDRRALRSCSCAASARSGYPGAVRGGEHAARRRTCSRSGVSALAVRRRRAAVGHLGLALDPERLAGGGRRRRAWRCCKTGDVVRVDLKQRTVDMLVRDAVLEARRVALKAAGGYRYPRSQTPWQEIQRAMVGALSEGMVLKPAVKYQRVAQTAGIPRRNH